MPIIYAIDFGTGDALAIHGPEGQVKKALLKLPRVKGGKTIAQEFSLVLRALLGGCDIPAGDVVFESGTIGASGCEVEDVLDLVSMYPERRIYTISCRAVKNYRKDNSLEWAKGARYAKDGQEPPVEITLEEQKAVHAEDAEIIYRIATEQPFRLYHWVRPSDGIVRKHRSVRPMDKRGYKDQRADEFMDLLPPFGTLPDELKEVCGDKKGNDYLRAFVMPFAMATEEPFIDAGPVYQRKVRFQKVIGLYDRGYPSFYRRASIAWMQKNAKQIASVTRIEEVSPAERKEAWKVTQRQIRWLFHLSMSHQGR